MCLCIHCFDGISYYFSARQAPRGACREPSFSLSDAFLVPLNTSLKTLKNVFKALYAVCLLFSHKLLQAALIQMHMSNQALVARSIVHCPVHLWMACASVEEK